MNLYKMKLHEFIILEYYKIIRVPGGWIYSDRYNDVQINTFVPFNNEFMQKNE